MDDLALDVISIEAPAPYIQYDSVTITSGDSEHRPHMKCPPRQDILEGDTEENGKLGLIWWDLDQIVFCWVMRLAINHGGFDVSSMNTPNMIIAQAIESHSNILLHY